MTDTIFGIPLNRFVLWAKPYVNLAAAAAAAWLVAKLNVLGIHGLNQANVATYLTAGLTGGLLFVFQQVADLHWVKGHHIELGWQSVKDARNAAAEVPPDVGGATSAEVADPVPAGDPGPPTRDPVV